MKIKNMAFILAYLMLPSYSSGADFLSNGIPYPFYTFQKAEDGFDNKMMILNSGIASLELRLQLIEKAQINVEVEYYIYRTDQSSRLLTNALVEAAKRGVKVRMLIDKFPYGFEFDEYYANELISHGVDVRYYNNVSRLAISSVNFRNHRKLLSVDDQYAITGGRNVGDEYFDFSKEFNFLDRDIYIEGPLVKPIRQSFDVFFEAKVAERPKFKKRPPKKIWKTRKAGTPTTRRLVDNTKAVKKFNTKLLNIKNYIYNSQELSSLRLRVSKAGEPILKASKLISCPEATFSSDAPYHHNFFPRMKERLKNKNRYLRKILFDKIHKIDEKLIIDSPYMISNRHSRKLMYQILQNKAKIKLYTNSLASTDAAFMAVNLYKDIGQLVKDGIKVNLHDGKYIHENEVFNEKVKETKWGTHSKSQIYYYKNEEPEFFVGTYNIDNRSDHYQTEMGIFCKGSHELVTTIVDNIDSRVAKAYKATGALTAISNITGEEVSVLGSNKDDQFYMILIAIPAWLIRFLL